MEQAGARCVLVVDDYQPLLRAYERRWRREGWCVWSATNRATALAIARRESLRLALVDLHLGDAESGIDVVRELKREHPALDLVLMSARECLDHAGDAIRAGAADVMRKPIVRPFQIDEIIERLERLGRAVASNSQDLPTLDQAKWAAIDRALAHCNGNLTKAARLLHIERRVLQRLLSKRPPSGP